MVLQRRSMETAVELVVELLVVLETKTKLELTCLHERLVKTLFTLIYNKTLLMKLGCSNYAALVFQ